MLNNPGEIGLTKTTGGNTPNAVPDRSKQFEDPEKDFVSKGSSTLFTNEGQ